LKRKKIKVERVPTSTANPPAWFEDIPQGVLAHKVVNIKKGQTIYSQGDECSRVYYINHGIIKLSTVSPHGKSAVISILGPGDLVGVECLTGETSHYTSAIALVRSTAVRMRSAVLLRALYDRPPAAAQFIDYLVKRYVRIERDLINYLVNSSEKRLARALLLLDRYSKDVDSSILETITQDMLADIVGTTRSRVNLFMNRFRKEGYIDYGPRGLIVNPSVQKAFQ
jgi:CRP/FNR family transcriptional regulator, cyclic AMP receptor protein